MLGRMKYALPCYLFSLLAGCDGASQESRAVDAAVLLSATYAEASAALVELGYTCVKGEGQFDLPNGKTRSVPTFLDCSKHGGPLEKGCPLHWRVIVIPEYGDVRETHFTETHRC